MSDDLEKHLAGLLRRLPATQAAQLLEFAEFLSSRHGVTGDAELPNEVSAEIPPPKDIPRPVEESVIKAVKRLRATYPMIDARNLLNQTSDLMTQHVVNGRDKNEVIEELEVLFRTHYDQMVGNKSQK